MAKADLPAKFIVTDLKGEVYRDSAYFLKKEGYEVLIWNLANDSSQWEPQRTCF